MAPSFFSKLKGSPSTTPNSSAQAREANKSFEASRDTTPEPTRSRVTSTGSTLASGPYPTITTTEVPPSQSLRTQPSLTIIPPTPRTTTYGGQEEPQNQNQRNSTIQQGRPIDGPPGAGLSRSHSNDDPLATPMPRRGSNISEWDFATGQATAEQKKSRTLTPASSKSSLRRGNNVPTIDVSSHTRAATSPAGLADSPEALVESPTSLSAGVVATTAFPHVESAARHPRSGSMFVESSATLMTPKKDSDVVSISSATKKKSSSPWRKNTSPSRKPTGLASALAASGMAMANPAMGRDMSPPPMPPMPLAPTTSQQSRKPTSRKSSNAHSTRSTSPRASIDKVKHNQRSGSRANSISDNRSELFNDSDSDSEESQSDDADLDMNEDDIPVTGFAVASNRRNADFHELFPTVPEGDYLIEDYGCALQREILIQGRIYISENHICFHANIFGWVTDLSIPIYEITSLERKMTAFVIPNGIQVTTRQAKYNFASFLARDTTFDVIYNIWRLARPDDASFDGGSSFDGSNSRTALDGRPDEGGAGAAKNGIVSPSAAGGKSKDVLPTRKATICLCGKEKTHYLETAMEAIMPGTPDTIYNLIFASGFIKDFMKVDQKLMDVQISDWTPMSPGSKLLSRNMSYIKPLNGSIGPKQTKCEIRDETIHMDFDDYVTTLTTTRTPDVPSGGVFSVKTKTCIMWATAVSSKVIITSQVEWTGRSFIKGIIERSCLEGQRTYHVDLEREMRKYIHEHQGEFVPEGVDPAALEPIAETPAAETTPKAAETAVATDATRERDRNQRGLQWAWDTFEGASQVAKRSTKGALELIRDTWEQSTSTSILYALVVVLVISNIWTLMMVGGREAAGRKKEMAKTEEREKWVQGVVTALWDEMAAGKVPGHGAPAAASPGPPVIIHDSAALANEVAGLQKALDVVEERLQKVRDSLASLKAMD